MQIQTDIQPRQSRIKEWMDKSQYDIIQLKQLAVNIQEKDQRLKIEQNNIKSIFHACPIPLFIKDKDFRYIEVNKAFEIFLNKTNEQIIGRTNDDIFNSKKLIKQINDIEFELFESGGVNRLDVCYIKEYQFRYWSIQETTFRNISTSISGIVGIIHNNTRYIKQLKFYKKIIELSPFPMIIAASTTILEINNAALEILEFKTKSTIKISDLDIISIENDSFNIKYSSGEFIKNKIDIKEFSIDDKMYTLISIL